MNGYVAKYLRISDDDEDMGGRKTESDSIGNQRKVLDVYIKNHPELSQYPLKEYLDDGFSGVNFHRPGIQGLLKEVRENRIVCIVVKDLSRFGRNYIEVGDYIEQIFPFMGVRFISVSDHYDSFQRPAGLEIGFKSLMHDLYSRDLSRKVKAVKQLYQKQGRYSGGDVPYGYRRNNGEGSVYVPDPEAADTVRKIFKIAAEGTPPVKIAELLSRESVLTPGVYKNQTIQQNYMLRNPKCTLWTPAQVREILQNEVYLGTYICHKLTSVRPREMKRNDRSGYLKFENDHEPLIEEKLFQAAQAAIRARGKRGTYNRDRNPHALKGKVKCGHCGYGMLRRGRRVDIYYCHMGNICGSHIRIQTDRLEASVLAAWRKLAETQRQKEREDKKNQAAFGFSKYREEKRLLEMKADYCKTGRLNLYAQWKQDQIAKEKYLIRRDELSKQEAVFRKELDALESYRTDHTFRQSEDSVEMGPGTVFEVQTLTKKFADDFIERVEVYGEDRIEITWRFQDITKQANI